MDDLKKLDYSSLPAAPKQPDHPEFLEIDLGRKRRWIGTGAYVLFYLLVASVLLVLFIKFTSSHWLAIGLVGFMVAYMTLMGWFASRNWEQRG